MAQLTATTFNQMRGYCDDATGRDFSVKTRKALQGIFDKYATELRTDVHYMAGDNWTELDIEVEGRMCVLAKSAAHGSYNPELWTIKPKTNTPVDMDKAASQQARLARMLGNAK